MKAALILSTILVLGFFSCKKTEQPAISKSQPQTIKFDKPDVIEMPEYIAARKQFYLSKKNPHNPHINPPTDTIINPPPPTYVPHQKILLLDFNGGTLPFGNVWGITSYAASGMNDEQIAATIARVRQAFAEFTNLTIDTSQAIYDTFPAADRQMEIYTVFSSWYGSAGGVSILNSLGTETPCFVFTQLLNLNTQFIGECGSHEGGHCFGLRHQSLYDQSCVKLGEYIYGQWIMGCSYYYQPYGMWRNQTGTNCYNNMNESATITNTLR